MSVSYQSRTLRGYGVDLDCVIRLVFNLASCEGLDASPSRLPLGRGGIFTVDVEHQIESVISGDFYVRVEFNSNYWTELREI